jgi:hypothetical protein
MQDSSLWGKISHGARWVKDQVTDEEGPSILETAKTFKNSLDMLDASAASMAAGNAMMANGENAQKLMEEAGDDPLKQAKASLAALQQSKEAVNQMAAASPELGGMYKKQLELAEKELEKTIVKLESGEIS